MHLLLHVLVLQQFMCTLLIRMCCPAPPVIPDAQNTSFVRGVGQNHRIIKLGAIYSARGDKKAAALPSSHTLSGVDVKGSFSAKGKISCWKVFTGASEKTLTGLAALGTSDQPSELAQEAAEQFVCSLYLPNTKICEIGDLHWLFFKKNQALSEKLPPTKAALQQAILRTHYQAMI